MRSMTAPRDWTVAQHFAIWVGVASIATGVVGLAINPDFAIGDDATAESFAGVDWNGWHGIAAILVGLPGVAVAWFPRFAVLYLVYRAVTDTAVGIWAALDDRPLGVLFLPTSGDAVFHVAVAGIAALGILLGRRGPSRTVQPA
jgi:hypothetical protein